MHWGVHRRTTRGRMGDGKPIPIDFFEVIPLTDDKQTLTLADPELAGLADRLARATALAKAADAEAKRLRHTLSTLGAGRYEAAGGSATLSVTAGAAQWTVDDPDAYRAWVTAHRPEMILRVPLADYLATQGVTMDGEGRVLTVSDQAFDPGYLATCSQADGVVRKEKPARIVVRLDKDFGAGAGKAVAGLLEGGR